METKTVTKQIYQCQFCDYDSSDSNAVLEHEKDHVAINKLVIGSSVKIMMNLGYDRDGPQTRFAEGTVIEKDAHKRRALIELDTRERHWVRAWELL